MHGLTCVRIFLFCIASWSHVNWLLSLSFMSGRFLRRYKFSILHNFMSGCFQVNMSQISFPILWYILPGEPGRIMDRAAIAQLSLFQLRTLIFLCLQEFGRRLGVTTNEDTVFRVSVGSVAPGDPISEAVFPAPAPGTPPLPRYLCVQRCSRCWRYCQDQNPARTEHLCPEHASEGSTHAPW